MNYYNPNNNYYMNYPYSAVGGQYSPSLQTTQSQLLQQSPLSAISPPPQQTPGLSGKIVDSEDIVRATEVPIGSYGIFPKADLSEIYIKVWNNNGTTNIITFKPAITQNTSIKESQEETSNKILEKIETLEGKIDNILSIKQKEPIPVETKPVVQSTTTTKKKEGVVSAY